MNIKKIFFEQIDPAYDMNIFRKHLVQHRTSIHVNNAHFLDFSVFTRKHIYPSPKFFLEKLKSACMTVDVLERTDIETAIQFVYGNGVLSETITTSPLLKRRHQRILQEWNVVRDVCRDVFGWVDVNDLHIDQWLLENFISVS